MSPAGITALVALAFAVIGAIAFFIGWVNDSGIVKIVSTILFVVAVVVLVVAGVIGIDQLIQKDWSKG